MFCQTNYDFIRISDLATADLRKFDMAVIHGPANLYFHSGSGLIWNEFGPTKQLNR